MATIKRNSSNQDYTNNSDGFDITGGTTRRTLTVSGSNITLLGSGSATLTFPTGSDSLVGYAYFNTYTGSIVRDSASFNSRINNISGGDTSGLTKTASFHPYSASINSFTASVTRDSASFDSRINAVVGGSGVSNAVFGEYTASIITNRQTSNYTLALSDRNKLVEMNSSSANLVTFPLNATVPIPTGSQFLISQYGSGSTSITSGSSTVLIKSPNDSLVFSGQYSAVSAIKRDVDEWYVWGDLGTSSFSIIGANGYLALFSGSNNLTGSILQQINNTILLTGSMLITGSFNIINEFTATDPEIPTNGVTLFQRYKAGRRMSAQMGPSGVDYQFQPVLFANKIGLWKALGNNLYVSTSSFGNTSTGSATVRNVSFNEGFLSTLRRVGYVTVNAASQSAGTRHGASQFSRGPRPGWGGFYYVARFGIQNTGSNYANMRIAVGLFENANPIPFNQQPTAQVNCLYVGKNSGSNNSFEFGYNDSTGTATTQSISSSIQFSVSGAYELRLFSPPSGSTVYFSFTRLDILSQTIEWSASVNIPSRTSSLSPQMTVNTGDVPMGVISIDPISQYIETDN